MTKYLKQEMIADMKAWKMVEKKIRLHLDPQGLKRGTVEDVNFHSRFLDIATIELQRLQENIDQLTKYEHL